MFFADETNLNESDTSRFFIYGGLIIPSNVAHKISQDINKIKQENNFSKTDELKFETRSRPKCVTNEQFNKAKESVIDVALHYKCIFLVNIIHHQIIKNQNQNQYIIKAADNVLSRFNMFLEENQTYGSVYLDRFSDLSEFDYMKNKFTQGINYPNWNKELTNILLYSSTRINASNFSTLVDIVLGAFRYAINMPKKKDLAVELMKKIYQLLWFKEENNLKTVNERGLIIRPQEVRSNVIKKEYEELIDHINTLLNK